MSGSDSKSDSGSTTRPGMMERILGFGAKKASLDQKGEIAAYIELFHGSDGRLYNLSPAQLGVMPEDDVRLFIKLRDVVKAQRDTLWKSKAYRERADSKDPTLGPELWLLASKQSEKSIKDVVSKFVISGHDTVKLTKQQEEEVSSIFEDTTKAGGLSSASASEAFAFGSGRRSFAAENPIFRPTTAPNWQDIDDNQWELLVMSLADGLEYDRFDSFAMREAIFSSGHAPSLNEFVTVCACYIFVGNNPTRLTDKVKNQSVGKAALGVLNRLQVVRSKINSQTITLARWAIAFSPAIWAMRNVYLAQGKLSGAGVITTTPLILQDVALSGIANRIRDGSQIEDFLIKFNRSLFDFKESKTATKTPESERDQIAIKFRDISLIGAASDSVLQEWDYNSNKEMSSIKEFYDLCSTMHATF